jgi:hypothetical protein
MILIVSLCIAGIAQTTMPVPQIANPLVPTAVAPGSAGFTLTVNGTGFVSGSTVYWNGSPRTTTYESAARLTAAINASDVAVPTSGSVTVHNPNGRISSSLPLLITNPEPALFFGSIQLSSYSGDVLAADFNGDGNQDVLLNLRTSVGLAFGNGDGSIQAPVVYSFANNTQGAGGGTLLGDFNNDGFPDVAAPALNPLTLQVLLNGGNGTMQLEPELNLSTDTAFYDSTAIADLNGDGNQDLILSADLSVGIALGNGDGTFQTLTYIPLPQNSTAVVVGDFNRDGIPDIAASLNNYSGFSILIGNGDGTFQQPVNYSSGIEISYLATADLNGDGYPDLIGSDLNSNSFYVMLNAGDGTFSPAVNYHGPQGTVEFGGIAPGDINGDGIVDVVIQAASFCSTNCIEVFLGNGDGSLQPAALYGIQQNIGGGQQGLISLADFNHDGKLDVGTPTPGGPYLMLQTAAPAPTLDPGFLSFASQAVGSQSPTQYVTLLQPGNTAITINSITSSSNFQSDGGCVGYVLNPGNTYCNAGVYFSPTTTGSLTGYLTINTSGGTQYVTLTGTATAAINVSVTPSSINFETVGLNSTSYTQWVYITNTGSQTLNLNSITLTGANPGDFLMTNPCGSTLAVGASCTVTVNFRPTMQGVRTASVAVSDNAANSPQMVALSGTGNALHVSNNLLSFGNVTVGTSSSLSLTLRNLGSRTILLSQIRFIANAADYSQSNDCNGRISVRSSCTMTVTFTPQTQGQLNSVLSFSSNGTGSQAVTSITLRGRGE